MERNTHVGTMGVRDGLRHYFQKHPHADYSWFKNKWNADVGYCASKAFNLAKLGGKIR